MSALVLDSGAFLAAERSDRNFHAQLRVAHAGGVDLRTTGVVVAQVWRDPSGRQATLARLLRAVSVEPVDESMGRHAGLLLGASGTHDAVDGTVVASARTGDTILTSDLEDIRRLVAASGRSIKVVAC